MNKAFVKEPEQSGSGSCPRCGSAGLPVGAVTLDAHLPAAARRGLADAAFFCPYARCEVAYFDGFERTVAVAALDKPVYPKMPDAPICACFGLTRDDIEQDVREGVVTRTRNCVARAKSVEARCSVMAPSGHSCVAEVQRYYMQARGTI
jgi:hypothetical protein